MGCTDVRAHFLTCDVPVLHTPQDCPAGAHQEPTTAELLGSFHKELIEQGLPDDIVRNLVTRAGREMVGENLVVRGI